jgi:creatinine amidohydrolase
MNEKFLLKDMTWVEFGERMKEDPVILIPLGSVEEQGPMAPMGDFMLTERVAELVAQKSGSIAAPTTPFGYAEYFRCMPGGVQLRAETFCSLLLDICENFLDHGLRRLIILNGHGGNMPLIEQTAYQLKQKHRVWVPSINLWRSITAEKWQEFHPELGVSAFGHGGDPMTSMYLHLFPKLMRMDLCEPAQRNDVLGLPTAGLNAIQFKGVNINVPLEVNDISDNGAIGGDASKSSAEIGEKIVNYVVDLAVDFVRYFNNVNPSAEKED